MQEVDGFDYGLYFNPHSPNSAFLPTILVTLVVLAVVRLLRFLYNRNSK